MKIQIDRSRGLCQAAAMSCGLHKTLDLAGSSLHRLICKHLSPDSRTCVWQSLCMRSLPVLHILASTTT